MSISVRLLWEASNSGRFREVVEYADEATHDLDQRRVDADPAMAAYLRRWHELLLDPVSVERHHDLTSLLRATGRQSAESPPAEGR
jgi:hypothetical protein